MADNRKRKDDRYPGVTHPAVAAVKCPTCGAKPGLPCIVGTYYAVAGEDQPRATRTHRTRLNLWKVGLQSERPRRR